MVFFIWTPLSLYGKCLLSPQCLQKQLKDQGERVGALERIVAQKEVLLLGMQEEKSSLLMELSSQKDVHHKQCTEIQEQAQHEKVSKYTSSIRALCLYEHTYTDTHERNSHSSFIIIPLS